MTQPREAGTAFIVPDDMLDDTDSALGEDIHSPAISLSSSVLDYRRENGRTYHAYKDGNLQHNLFLLTFDDKLGLAPPNKPDAKVKHVLDVGTGTGIWAIDFADKHPEAHVIGVDLSPTQPEFLPVNVNFYIEDIEDDWTHSQPFDYIHSRLMTSSVADWTSYLTKCFTNLTSGGYLELQEVDINIESDDGTLSPDNIMLKSLALLTEASIKFGRPYQNIPALADIMTKIGFVDVVVERFKWPINTWPDDEKAKLLGCWCYTNMCYGLEAFTMAPLTRAHGWTPEEVDLWLVDQKKAMADPNTHAYWPIYSIYGRKPLE
ncbi:hypothetical protein F53441_10169 [Fusarium austroafricanum]|uniref:Methyltransferase domain-containing protein n=1 Tax=Fusarium austroafricanum TaxID=2364996 RepID=A0A8H4NUU1_9HYPO|nr:hypothetical protein F53441_10169 [Fusarium austroafricanum]